jgi:MFS family permease
MPLSMFKNNVVAICNLASFLTSMGMFGAITFIPLFYQGVLGTSATASGNMMIPMSMAVMVSSFIGGQWLSKSGGRYRWQGIIGTAFIGLGMLLLGRLTQNSALWNVILGLVTTGIGMGLTMPVFTIAIQNAVPYSQLGVATSASTFLRSLGGSVGLAILGSIVNNQFLSSFIGGIPAAVKNVVPMDQITALAHNPQALVNPAAQAQLQALLTQSGDTSIFDQVMLALRAALSSSITQAFLVGSGFVLVGLVAIFFLKEVKVQTANPEAQGVPKPVEEKE